MRMLVSSLVVCLLLATIHADVDDYKTYSQHQLWRLHMKNNEQVGQLLDFSRRAHQQGINFWSEEFRINVPVSWSFQIAEKSLFCLDRSTWALPPSPSVALLNTWRFTTSSTRWRWRISGRPSLDKTWTISWKPRRTTPTISPTINITRSKKSMLGSIKWFRPILHWPVHSSSDNPTRSVIWKA